jgi:hypothetical protein
MVVSPSPAANPAERCGAVESPMRQCVIGDATGYDRKASRTGDRACLPEGEYRLALKKKGVMMRRTVPGTGTFLKLFPGVSAFFIQSIRNRKLMSARQETKQNETQANGGGRGGAASGRNGADNVDKIRELLFGEQMAGYEARFSALEAKLSAEVETLRRNVEDHLAELRAHLEKRADEVESLSVPRAQIAESLEKLAATLRG